MYSPLLDNHPYVEVFVVTKKNCNKFVLLCDSCKFISVIYCYIVNITIYFVVGNRQSCLTVGIAPWLSKFFSTVYAVAVKSNL